LELEEFNAWADALMTVPELPGTLAELFATGAREEDVQALAMEKLRESARKIGVHGNSRSGPVVTQSSREALVRDFHRTLRGLVEDGQLVL
jgi:hypothetical protein